MNTTRQDILNAITGETLTARQITTFLQEKGNKLILISDVYRILQRLYNSGIVEKKKVKSGGFWIIGWKKI